MKPYPLLFHPILKPRIWGGRRLAELGKPLPKGLNIGESWEIADLPESVQDGRSIIANGELAGMTLREAISCHGEAIIGAAGLTPDGGFSLLIKFLDARENLSVQVHPDEAYVASHPEAHLKSEAWVVIRAEPGAVIYKGLKPEVTRTEFSQHIRSGEVVNDLMAVPVREGECHYLPSGTCHALGAGVLVAEIQTPSDTTFRMYDWGRSGRELHIQEALQCIRFGPAADNPPPPQPPIESAGVRTTTLRVTDFFQIDRLDALAATEFTVVTSGMPEAWMMIDGSGRLLSPTGPVVDLVQGTTALIPAGLNKWRARLDHPSWLLRIKLPSPLQGMIA